MVAFVGLERACAPHGAGDGRKEIGVIGCGALGLTSALLAQRAGLAVRIYARELPPDVFSMRASGVWTPDSRICDAEHAAAFGDRWEEMTRTSFRTYQSLLGLPGKPIEWIDGYALSDAPFGTPEPPVPDEPEYGGFHDTCARSHATARRTRDRNSSVSAGSCQTLHDNDVQHQQLCADADVGLSCCRRQDRSARVPPSARAHDTSRTHADQRDRLRRSRVVQ